MSVQSARAQLADAALGLKELWSRTRESWDDPISQQIEKEHIFPLLADIQATISNTGETVDTLRRMESECSE